VFSVAKTIDRDCLNFKVTTFVSPVTDPRTYAVDAMGLSWEGMFAYAFPPFRFLAPVLHKITKFPLCIDWC
jgi:hypothetical protein